jgi:hypothetical protein
MYLPEDATIYEDIYDSLNKKIIEKIGNPIGWDDHTYKDNKYKSRSLLRIGSGA